MFNIISTQDQSAFAMLNQRLSIDWSHWIIWIYEALVLGEKERSWLAEKNTKHGEQAWQATIDQLWNHFLDATPGRRPISALMFRWYWKIWCRAWIQFLEYGMPACQQSLATFVNKKMIKKKIVIMESKLFNDCFGLLWIFVFGAQMNLKKGTSTTKLHEDRVAHIGWIPIRFKSRYSNCPRRAGFWSAVCASHGMIVPWWLDPTQVCPNPPKKRKIWNIKSASKASGKANSFFFN